MREVFRLDSQAGQIDTVLPTAQDAATFLRSCVAQPLSNGGGPATGSRFSVILREYDEDLILIFQMFYAEIYP